MFTKHDDTGYNEVLPDIRMKVLVHGADTMMTEFLLKKYSVLPEHNHFHEQTGYLVSGKMLLTIGEEAFEVNAGDSWNVASNVSHKAEILEDSVVIEVFHPVRDDFLEC